MTLRDRLAFDLLILAGDLDEPSARAHLESTVHDGDCYGDPWTCLVCYADKHRKMADWLLERYEMRARSE